MHDNYNSGHKNNVEQSNGHDKNLLQVQQTCLDSSEVLLAALRVRLH
jgi:hypothetical protein